MVRAQLFWDSISAVFIHANLQGFTLQITQSVILTLAHKVDESGFVLGCGLALSATVRTFNLFKLILQRGFKLIQLGQLAVKCFNFSGQLAFSASIASMRLSFFALKIIEFLLQILRDLLNVFNFDCHNSTPD